jgi:hypothetical protein
VVFCCDANFGMLPRDIEIAADAVEMKRRYGSPRTLAVQNTKNATERSYAVQTMLASAERNLRHDLVAIDRSAGVEIDQAR